MSVTAPQGQAEQAAFELRATTFTLPTLEKLGFAPERVYTTLENRMKCGLGKCGRCNIGPVYVCKDGPVFTAAQIKALPQEF